MSEPTLSDADRRDWLRLARTEGVGPVTFAQLIGRFGTAARAIAALPDLARRGGRATASRTPSPAEADRELDAGAKLGARLICSAEAEFPPLLAAIDPPPPLIWARGDAALLQRPAVAIVGARIASAAGQGFARGLARELGLAGYLVVSGMARSVDGAAHGVRWRPARPRCWAAGSTTSIPDHADLLCPAYARPVERGCIVSESPRGRGPRRGTFPAATG
jgi:DNA processing protein